MATAPTALATTVTTDLAVYLSLWSKTATSPPAALRTSAEASIERLMPQVHALIGS